VGGICRAGFVIADVMEPDHVRPGAVPGSAGHRVAFLAPYLRVLARRMPATASARAVVLVESAG